jgi:hypothetical protein
VFLTREWFTGGSISPVAEEMTKYEEVKTGPGKTTKNLASESAFQLMKATFNIGNLMGEVAPPPQPPPGRRDRSPSVGAAAATPPVSPPVLVVEGGDGGGGEPSFRAERPRCPSFNSVKGGSRSSSPARKLSVGDGSPKTKPKNKFGLAAPATLFRRFSTTAVDDDGRESDGGGAGSGASTPRGHRRSIVGEMIDGVTLFKRNRSTSVASGGGGHKSGRGDDAGDDADKEGYEHEVLTGFDYLDVTARYMMNLWTNEKVQIAR